MTDAKLQAFSNRLQKVWKHYSKTARRQGVTCFRFYDHDLPEAPFAIDWYEGAVHAAEYRRRHGMEEEEHEAWLAACRAIIAATTGVEESAVFMKERRRKEGRQDQYEKAAAEKTERIVREGELSFIINLSDYLDTGLFLDHRLTRARVGKESGGKRVLNLFCYTGSFSVYAADGGAATVTSVDLSNTYCHWAKRNLQYNKLYDERRTPIIAADVLQWLKTAPDAAFDLIVCDPPTFSNSKRMEAVWDVQRDHPGLIHDLLGLLAPGGEIYFSTNRRGFSLYPMTSSGVAVTDLTKQTTPFDFEGKLERVCFRISGG